MTHIETRTHRVVTYDATLILDGGEIVEFDLPFDPGHVDLNGHAWGPDRQTLPVMQATRVMDDVMVVSLLVDDNDRSEFEWGDIEFREFNSGYDRDQWWDANVLTCADCGWGRDDHGTDIDDSVIGRPCDAFRPEIDFTAENGWFKVEKYEHGLVRYALTLESSQVDRRWDVAPFCAYLHLPVGPDGFTDPTEAARAWLAEYTDWCNGNVYGICHLWLRRRPEGDWYVDSDETCWGYIGEWNAAENMNMEHDARVKDNTQ